MFCLVDFPAFMGEIVPIRVDHLPTTNHFLGLSRSPMFDNLYNIVKFLKLHETLKNFFRDELFVLLLEGSDLSKETLRLDKQQKSNQITKVDNP